MDERGIMYLDWSLALYGEHGDEEGGGGEGRDLESVGGGKEGKVIKKEEPKAVLGLVL
jgi:hypothetical protein